MLERIGAYINNVYHRYLEAGLVGAKVSLIEGKKGGERLELFQRQSFHWTMLELDNSFLLLPDQSIVWQYDEKGKLKHCVGADLFTHIQKRPIKPIEGIEVIDLTPTPHLKEAVVAA